ncbi:hypothetical protein [Roseicyclus amphidinii]|uniref:hypothetical protein n=1 Tax=Roseicyclus amphidinii TaxID=3034232 RepID=UPI0024E0FBDA|nr:hypothetical protein [Roseicyclus sp. Amp-Y-6]
MTVNLTPLDVCKRLIGREEVLADICSVHAKAPYHWNRAAAYRDAGDVPSARYQRVLLRHSEQHKLGLTARHLIEGAPEAEIEAILAARAAAPLMQDGPQEAA